MKRLIFIYPLFFLSSFCYTKAQPSRAWEFGVQGAAYNINRVNNVSFTAGKTSNNIKLDIKSLAYTGGIYIGKEIFDMVVADFQSGIGIMDKKLLSSLGLGLQYRFGYHFSKPESPYIDPFFRVGIDYIYMGNKVIYYNSGDSISWRMRNIGNSDGKGENHITPIRLSAGLNMWLNDRWGIRTELGYSQTLRKNVASHTHGTVGVVYRIGGKSKKRIVETPVYVDRVVEKEVEVIVEKEVEIIVEKEIDSVVLNRHVKQFLKETDFVRAVFFDLDSHELSEAAKETLFTTSLIMKMDTDNRFIIQGHTDGVGNYDYNLNLSMRRANAVMDYLLKEGVPDYMLKIVGHGPRIANMPISMPISARARDRRVTIEAIEDLEYWNALPALP